jgi:hypothetical protein
VPRGKLAVLQAWALTVLDAAVPAYAVIGLGEYVMQVEKSTACHRWS